MPVSLCTLYISTQARSRFVKNAAELSSKEWASPISLTSLSAGVFQEPAYEIYNMHNSVPAKESCAIAYKTLTMKGSVPMPLPRAKTHTEEDYYNTPEDVRVELIDGQFYDMAAPSRAHQDILMFLSNKIANYINSKDGPCRIYPAPFAVELSHDRKHIVEPDISVICDPNKLTDKGCFGAPDWIIEIVSPSDPGHDYITKLSLYATAGVKEYWIVDPQEKKTTVYCLEQDKFKMQTYTFQDTVKVNIYDDLYLDFSGLKL